MNEQDENGKRRWPKHLNPADTPIYDKSKVLYGFNFAQKTIRQTETAILCEGYNDVIAMHQAGFTNAVASCGTNITEEQVKLIARNATTVILMFDNDSAGITATEKVIPMFLKHDLMVQFCFCPQEMTPIASCVTMAI